MIPVYNGANIIEEVIQHALSQGLELVVLDNGSTDSSYEICKKVQENGQIILRQFKTETFNFPLVLRILYDMALTKNPDWLVRIDQDEFLETGIENLTLKEGIKQEDKNGNNIVQFDVFEFFMTNEDNISVKSTKEKFPYYSWQHDYAYRAWKNIPGTRVEDGGGHYPVFPVEQNYKLSPKKYVLRHYRFRDKEQAIKNNEERIDRVKNLPERKIGWYEHFEKISKTNFFEHVNHKLLNRYKNDNNWNYEPKFRPFVLSEHPRRNDMFSSEGKMLRAHPSLIDLHSVIRENEEKILKLETEISKKDHSGKYVDEKENNSQIKRPFLLITGMHRSGTSFLSRALNLAGVYLGRFEEMVSTDWSPHKDNLRGHWENIKFLELGEKTLALSKGSWMNVPKTIIINEQIGQEIKNAVKELTEPPSLMAGFKDPRILVCLDAWKKYLPTNIFIVGIFRNPMKVAESLKKRNKLEYDQSIELWKIYNQNLLNFLEKYNGFLLNFDWPKEMLLKELHMICKKLGLAENVDLSKWYTEKIISSDKTSDLNYNIPADAQNIYTKLQNRSEKNTDVKTFRKNYTNQDLYSMIKGLLTELQYQGNYFKKINDENLTRIKLLTKKSDPFSFLFSIYFQRNDLKEAYPEVMKGELSGLIKWAKDECLNGSDWMRKELEQFKEFYINFNQNLLENYEFKEKKEKLESEVYLLKESIDKKEQELNKVKIENAFFKKELEKIQNSFTWKILRKYDRVRGKK